MTDERIIKKERDTNIELLRCLAMIAIIGCHMIAHSGIEYSSFSINSAFASVLTIGGTIGDNLFVLITGYFYQKNGFSIKKIALLIIEVSFYSTVLYIVSCLVGATTFSIKYLVQSMVILLSGDGYWFIRMYIELCFVMPIISIGLKNCNLKLTGVGILLFVFLWSFIPFTIGKFISTNDFGYNRFSWMVLVYCIGAFIYNVKNRFNGNRIAILTAVSSLSILISARIASLWAMENNASKLLLTILEKIGEDRLFGFLPLILSVSLFIIVQGSNVKYNRLINTLASSTFGVYLIHNNIYFREYIWNSIFKIPELFHSTMFPILSVFVVVSIFAISVLIDLIRKRYIEKWFILLKK